MGDKQTVKQTIDALDSDQLETADEAAAKEARPPKRVELTSELVLQVVAMIKQGADFRTIKRAVIATGPKGQKWKLSRAQIEGIARYRKRRYDRLNPTPVDDDV